MRKGFVVQKSLNIDLRRLSDDSAPANARGGIENPIYVLPNLKKSSNECRKERSVQSLSFLPFYLYFMTDISILYIIPFSDKKIFSISRENFFACAKA